MTAPQHIFRVRRQYNQWVNNQTLEDYSLRFTAKSARRWSLARVANTALGGISFLALEAIGAVNTLSYGFDNALAATLVVGFLIFFMGLPICYYAARYGVDIDLLTRGAGFGYIGSTVTSLIYASFTFIFFALEAAIMAMALFYLFSLPLYIGYVVCSLLIIPLVTYGITLISRIQLWSQPIWVFLQLLPFMAIFWHESQLFAGWSSYPGVGATERDFNLVYFGAACAVLFSLIAQIGEQVDYLRFMPEKRAENRVAWWASLVMAGPGWIVLGVVKILAGSLLAYLAVTRGLPADQAADPTQMYSMAFSYITQSPQLALALAGVFVILSQIKINVTNAYAGSIAWSNFFSRLTHSHPGRVVWLVFNVVISLMLMELGIYQAFEATLGVYAIVAVAWVGSLVADLVINKPLGLSPKHIEFKRAYLYDINPVGLGSMLIATALGVVCYLGVLGASAKSLAHFIALLSTFIAVPLIAVLTKSRFYIARVETQSDKILVKAVASNTYSLVDCCVCQNPYETEDIAFCPAYKGAICSLCCSLDSRCQDSCKPHPHISYYLQQALQRVLPASLSRAVSKSSLHFIALLGLIGGITGILLLLIYMNTQLPDPTMYPLLQQVLWKVFFILMIIAGVIIWLFVLAHESRLVAQDESQRQNKLLLEEISAHQATDMQLQSAKEQAEAANNAKSRYLTGISHELRTPLNAILGYAQLLENDLEIPASKREKIAVMRHSGQHLEDLIEGLLDISKIEAGRLDIRRDNVRIAKLVEQIVTLFRLQAEEKGLEFIYEQVTALPERVVTDEKRLRQILINLLSNAIKYTQKGFVKLQVKYRNQVAEFSIDDSGIGIAPEDLERIFKPFERIRKPGMPSVMGTGLGLTITRLLTDIMGGELQVLPTPNGTQFKVWLMLSQVVNPERPEEKPQPILGYTGSRKSLVVVDDDAPHRGLITDVLTPLGFDVVEAQDAESLLALLEDFNPDAYLLDVNLPGMSGWQLAQTLRQSNKAAPIIMLSADAKEGQGSHNSGVPVHSAYLIKPIKLDVLLDALQRALHIQWRYDAEPKNNEVVVAEKTLHWDRDLLEELIAQAEIGHLSGFKHLLQLAEQSLGVEHPVLKTVRLHMQKMQFGIIIKTLREQL
jgi:signal transduction histidine kinase/DNA-binding response OmpR family regulator